MANSKIWLLEDLCNLVPSVPSNFEACAARILGEVGIFRITDFSKKNYRQFSVQGRQFDSIYFNNITTSNLDFYIKSLTTFNEVFQTVELFQCKKLLNQINVRRTGSRDIPLFARICLLVFVPSSLRYTFWGSCGGDFIEIIIIIFVPNPLTKRKIIET